MKKNDFPVTQELVDFLFVLLKGEFQLNSLERNKELLKSLNDLQRILFDRNQRYDYPGYHYQPIEKELRCLSKILRTVIATQILEKEFKNKEEIKTIFEYFEFVSLIDSPRDGVSYENQIDEKLKNKTKDYLANIIIKRVERNKKYYFLLEKIKDHYNWSNLIYKRITMIIE